MANPYGLSSDSWDIAFKESIKATTYDNMLAKLDMMWGEMNSSTVYCMTKSYGTLKCQMLA